MEVFLCYVPVLRLLKCIHWLIKISGKILLASPINLFPTKTPNGQAHVVEKVEVSAVVSKNNKTLREKNKELFSFF